MLRLETETCARPIDMAALPDERAIQLVARIELDARLRRGDLQSPARPGLDNARRRRQALPASSKNEVVVVSHAEAHLLVIRVDARANRRLLPEVEGRSVDGRQLAGRNLSRVNWRVAVSVKRQSMIQHIA
jgi:hypothetical protein